MSIEKAIKECMTDFGQIRAKATAWGNLGLRKAALYHARTGDWSYLIEYLRLDSSVTSEMRLLIADILEGRSRAKMGAEKRFNRKYQIVKFILEAQSRGEREKDYSRKAEEKFGQTWRHLRRVLEDKWLCGFVPLGEHLLTTFKEQVEALRPYVDRRPHTYIVNTDTALTPYTMSPSMT